MREWNVTRWHGAKPQQRLGQQGREHENPHGDKERQDRYRRFRATLSFSQPPTLRVGLIDILAEIGGAHAEAAVAELLDTTARGFEIAYAAKTLQGWLGRDAYRDEALEVSPEQVTTTVQMSEVVVLQ